MKPSQSEPPSRCKRRQKLSPRGLSAGSARMSYTACTSTQCARPFERSSQSVRGAGLCRISCTIVHWHLSWIRDSRLFRRQGADGCGSSGLASWPTVIQQSLSMRSMTRFSPQTDRTFAWDSYIQSGQYSGSQPLLCRSPASLAELKSLSRTATLSLTAVEHRSR